MGTQQILMIVLSVIVVGAAIAVGIVMFDTQATNSARDQVASQLSQFAVGAQGWYRTPTMMGGAGEVPANIDATRIARHLNQADDGAVITLPSGVYTVAATAGSEITIEGVVVRPRATITMLATVDLAGNHEDIDVEQI
jgi:hypothetical protein